MVWFSFVVFQLNEVLGKTFLAFLLSLAAAYRLGGIRLEHWSATQHNSDRVAACSIEVIFGKTK
jgi:hypothetical protein